MPPQSVPTVPMQHPDLLHQRAHHNHAPNNYNKPIPINCDSMIQCREQLGSTVLLQLPTVIIQHHMIRVFAGGSGGAQPPPPPFKKKRGGAGGQAE
jgi:hypothetical protein